MSSGKELGFATASVISTGNAAASVAAYAAAAGMQSIVMVPKGTAASTNQVPSPCPRRDCHRSVDDGRFDYEVAELIQEGSRGVRLVRLSCRPIPIVSARRVCFELVDQLVTGGYRLGELHPQPPGRHAGILYVAGLQGNPRPSVGSSTCPSWSRPERSGGAVRRRWRMGASRSQPVDARGTVAGSIQVGNPSALGDRAPGGIARGFAGHRGGCA